MWNEACRRNMATYVSQQTIFFHTTTHVQSDTSLSSSFRANWLLLLSIQTTVVYKDKHRITASRQKQHFTPFYWATRIQRSNKYGDHALFYSPACRRQSSIVMHLTSVIAILLSIMPHTHHWTTMHCFIKPLQNGAAFELSHLFQATMCEIFKRWSAKTDDTLWKLWTMMMKYFCAWATLHAISKSASA